MNKKKITGAENFLWSTFSMNEHFCIRNIYINCTKSLIHRAHKLINQTLNQNKSKYKLEKQI